jgi:hypothetical protein
LFTERFIPRKLRNRLSQQAFRRRQAEYVKELQKRVDAGSWPQNEAFKALQEENAHLRKQLVEFQSKLARLIATIQSLSGSVSEALGESTEDMPKSMYEETGSSGDPGRRVNLDHLPGLGQLNSVASHAVGQCGPSQPSFDFSAATSYLSEESIEVAGAFLVEPAIDSFGLQADPGNSNNLSPQIPNIWNYDYQMGLQAYANALSGSENSSITLGKNWTETNSPFSDHISVLRHIMRQKVEQNRSLNQQPAQ